MSKSFSLIPLGEIATPISRTVQVLPGNSYRTIGVKWWGEGAYERETIDGSQTAAKTLSLVCEGDLIINKIWVRHGSTAIAPKAVDGCAASGEFPTFTLNQERVLPRWLHWQTKTPAFWEKCDNLSRGTSGKNRIKPELFLTIQVPIPPLPEQRRIVARIEELAAKIEEARRLRKEATELGDTFRTNAVFATVQECPTVPLGSIAEVRSGVTLGRNLRGTTISVPYLRVANVQDGYLDLRVVKSVEIVPEEMEKWRLATGDVLLTEGGDWDKLGRGTVWRDEIKGCIHQNHIFRVRFDPQIYLPEYIAALMSSPQGKKYFQNASKQTTNLASINQRQLKEFPVSVLAPEDQRRIITRLEKLKANINRLKEMQSETATELDALMPAVLNKAFRGEL